ncbi:alpha/beta hydrolase [Agromyces sp. MMS24-K17]|uniref:alpha/beta hydrolase n=1 Tax=Agromyces sp. MMS24-K17 TaxID=3372850 RepID=UPI0037541904
MLAATADAERPWTRAIRRGRVASLHGIGAPGRSDASGRALPRPASRGDTVVTFHPDLRAARFIPNVPASPRIIRAMRRAGARMQPPPAPDDVRIEEVTVPGPAGAPDVRVRLYRPVAAPIATTSADDATAPAPAPALLWIHGGGFVQGSPIQDEASSIGFVRALGITVAAPTYRLSPDVVAPAALEDAYAALTWLFRNAGDLGIDAERIAVGGASAGAGLAAGLVLLAHDRGEVRPAFQLLVYPMLDDRTVVRDDHDTTGVRIWSPALNRYGWTSYLGCEPGGADVSPYAAPARRDELAGLPPAWIGVGTLDLFHDEDVRHAERLNAAGVPTELVLVDGAFHGFDAIFRTRPVSRAFYEEQVSALRRALLD